MNTPESVINFSVYEDSVEYYGIAKATLPDLQNMTQTISGAGIAGEVESVIIGHFSAMSLTLNFRTVTDNAVRLTEQRVHKLELRAAQQQKNSAAGISTVSPVKYVVLATPKKLGLGTLAPASPGDASGEYSLSYLAAYVDGNKLIEIDPLNYMCLFNGIDYLAEVRKALGK